MTTVAYMNVSGLTPSLLGAGLDFDVELTAIPRANPLQFTGTINGKVNLDIDALLSDEAGTFQITPEASMSIAGLTPAALSTGLDFDIEHTAVQPENPIKFTGEINGQVRITAEDLLADEAGTLEIIERAAMNINGLTPALLGSGKDFDIEFAPAQPNNPIKLAGEINGQVEINAAALTGDEQGTMQIIPVAEVTVVGLTPEALGSGLPWDAMRQTDGYLTPAAREAGDPEERVIEVAWEPNENPAPFDAPVVRPNEPGQPVVGTMPMLEENYLGEEAMLFTLNAAGTFEGSDDGERTERFSVQPVSFEKALAVSSKTQGRQTFCLRGDTALNSVEDPGATDYVEIGGKTYECVAVLPWQNGILNHYENYVSSFVPVAVPE